MKKFIVFVLFILNINNLSYCQNLSANKKYFEKYMLPLDSIFFDTKNAIGLNSYQVYFFGENHRSKLSPHKETRLIDYLANRVKCVFNEMPVNYVSIINKKFNYKTLDTNVVTFKDIGGIEANEILLRFLYRYNVEKSDSNKIAIFPIDMVYKDAISNYELEYFFKKKLRPKAIKIGYHYLLDINNDTLKYSNIDTLLRKYELFRDHFYSNTKSYEKYLKSNYEDLKLNINGIYTYSIARKEDAIYDGAVSNIREEFMLNNILDKIEKHKIESFVSINGSLHVTLTTKENWEGEYNIESLAHRFRRLNPNMRVCSIYFMDLTEDDLGKYFQKEKQLILENIKPGETYLIRLDGENTPFKELSEKFQYIVVW